MRIGIDVMGGDYAPEVAVRGAVRASRRVSSDSVIVMFGDKLQIEELLSLEGECPENIEIVHTSEVIEMNDSPTQAFSKKSDSSIVVGFKALCQGTIDAFASAGSTGAMLVGCMHILNLIDGVIRPTIAAPLPTTSGGDVMILDVGLNVDCKPEVLCQYATLGSVYYNVMMESSEPRVALLNIGEEEEKGNSQTKATYSLLQENSDINFVGNIESKYIFDGNKADVIVCDGFIGNTILKMAEGIYSTLNGSVGVEKLKFFEKLNYESQGGTPVLGVNGVVIIGHGCSSDIAIESMVIQAERAVRGNLVGKIKEVFANGKQEN